MLADKKIFVKKIKFERVRGVEPLSGPWQGPIIPVYDTRNLYYSIKIWPFDKCCHISDFALLWKCRY